MRSRAVVHISGGNSLADYFQYLIGMATDWKVLSAAAATFLASVCRLLALQRLELGYAFPFMTLTLCWSRRLQGSFWGSPFRRFSCLVWSGGCRRKCPCACKVSPGRRKTETARQERCCSPSYHFYITHKFLTFDSRPRKSRYGSDLRQAHSLKVIDSNPIPTTKVRYCFYSVNLKSPPSGAAFYGYCRIVAATHQRRFESSAPASQSAFGQFTETPNLDPSTPSIPCLNSQISDLGALIAGSLR
jgi:hypothetical protein